MGVGRMVLPIFEWFVCVVNNATAAYTKHIKCAIFSSYNNVAQWEPCEGTPIHGILT